MKHAEKWLILFVLLGALIIYASAKEGEGKGKKAKDDSELGLSKSSVFATPDPIVPSSQAKMPGESTPLKGYFSAVPPSIPHQVADFLPITVNNNQCVECHDLPDQIGKKREAGETTPIPASHYTDLRRAPDKITKKLVGARFFCIQCHAPQTDAKPLVENTYHQ